MDTAAYKSQIWNVEMNIVKENLRFEYFELH